MPKQPKKEVKQNSQSRQAKQIENRREEYEAQKKSIDNLNRTCGQKLSRLEKHGLDTANLREEYQILKVLLHGEKFEFKYAIAQTTTQRSILECLRNYLFRLQEAMGDFVQFLKKIYKKACTTLLSRNGAAIGCGTLL